MPSSDASVMTPRPPIWMATRMTTRPQRRPVLAGGHDDQAGDGAGGGRGEQRVDERGALSARRRPRRRQAERDDADDQAEHAEREPGGGLPCGAVDELAPPPRHARATPRHRTSRNRPALAGRGNSGTPRRVARPDRRALDAAGSTAAGAGCDGERMTSSAPVRVVWSREMLAYDFGHGHPMTSERLDLTIRLAEDARPARRRRRRAGRRAQVASDALLQTVHDARLRRRRARRVRRTALPTPRTAWARPTTRCSRDMHEASARVVQGSVDSALAVWEGRARARRQRHGRPAPRDAGVGVGLLRLQRRRGRHPRAARRGRAARGLRRRRRAPRRRRAGRVLGRPAGAHGLGARDRAGAVPGHRPRPGDRRTGRRGHGGQRRAARRAPATPAGCGRSTPSCRPWCARSTRTCWSPSTAATRTCWTR